MTTIPGVPDTSVSWKKDPDTDTISIRIFGIPTARGNLILRWADQIALETNSPLPPLKHDDLDEYEKLVTLFCIPVHAAVQSMQDAHLGNISEHILERFTSPSIPGHLMAASHTFAWNVLLTGVIDIHDLIRDKKLLPSLPPRVVNQIEFHQHDFHLDEEAIEYWNDFLDVHNPIGNLTDHG